jgi:hypothetical protein
MDRYTMVVALTGQICGTILLISLVAAWVSRRRGAAGTLSREWPHRLEARLMEMQQSLDTMAVEVERISEAQRFATKLLSERGNAMLNDANGARDAVRVSPSR